MSIQRTMIIHSIAEDGLPNMDDRAMVGRVAFIFDGAVISGWPAGDYDEDAGDYEEALWEGSENRVIGKFGSVTHWIEFDVPGWELAKGRTDHG